VVAVLLGVLVWREWPETVMLALALRNSRVTGMTSPHSGGGVT